MRQEPVLGRPHRILLSYNVTPEEPTNQSSDEEREPFKIKLDFSI